MATTPVPMKQSKAAVSGTPEVSRSFRTEMDRLFDRFTSGLGILPFPSFRSELAFGTVSRSRYQRG
jgi:HSP20 family protein